jgi:hypothetical protein
VWYETKITVGRDGLVTTTGVNLRMGPSTAYKLLGSVKQGAQLRPSGKTWYQGSLWFYCSAGWFIGKYVEGWIQEENGRWWYITDGAKWPAGILTEIDGSTYAFDKSGWMITADRIAEDGHIM